jgi:putative ABC transport system permease protein
VKSAAFSDGLPLTGSETITGFTMRSLQPPIGDAIHVGAARRVVSPDYFAALGTPIVEGRSFQASDGPSAPKVVIVNQAFAKKYLTDHPIGDKIMNFIEDDNQEYEVVGIIPQVRERGLADPIGPEIYSLTSQANARAIATTSFLILRTNGDARSLMDSVRSIVTEEEPSLIIDSLRPMEDALMRTLQRPRFYAFLLDGFAGFVLIIAGVGLFGVLSYSVAQRSGEIAVRTAMGARPSDIARLVLRQAATITSAGLAIGIAASLAFGKYLSTLVYGVSTRDAATLILVPLVLAVVAAVACFLPAHRASRIDPVRILRTQF